MDSERKEFERWFEGHCLPCESNWFERDADGDYKFNATGHAWDGWQARAELGRAECEALRKDAERYRWLRKFPHNVDAAVYGATKTDDCGLLRRDIYLDAAIDAAMGKESGNGQ